MGETNTMSARAHAVALFSGGLDSILAARLLMEQGLTVRCLHRHALFRQAGTDPALGSDLWPEH